MSQNPAPLKVPAREQLPGVEVDLRADGVLWLINTSVFHPRGFALSVVEPTGELRLLGDGTEPWQYGTDPNHPGRVDVDALFEATRNLFERAAKANRA